MSESAPESEPTRPSPERTLRARLARLVASPWPITLGVLLPIVAWLGWVHWRGLMAGALDHRSERILDEGSDVISHLEGSGVIELWVHGTQPWFSWVPYIHPPGYSVFMNLTNYTAYKFGGDDLSVFHHIFWQGVVFKAVVMLLLAWALTRWKGAPWGILGAALYAFSPNSLRPFEHYPLATLLGAVTVVALVEWGLHGDTRRRNIAIGAVLVSVLLHLSLWFIIGGLVAGLFFLHPERRKEIAVASVVMIGAFMLVTPLPNSSQSLYEVLDFGTGTEPGRNIGVVTIEWTNPFLLVMSLLVFLPWVRQERVPTCLGCGVVLFTGVTVVLQHFQLADGQPYPFSLHYFELLEPTLVLAGTWVLATLWQRSSGRLRWLVLGLVLLLLASQVGFFIYSQKWVFTNPLWFWMLLIP